MVEELLESWVEEGAALKVYPALGAAVELVLGSEEVVVLQMAHEYL